MENFPPGCPNELSTTYHTMIEAENKTRLISDVLRSSAIPISNRTRVTSLLFQRLRARTCKAHRSAIKAIAIVPAGTPPPNRTRHNLSVCVIRKGNHGFLHPKQIDIFLWRSSAWRWICSPDRDVVTPRPRSVTSGQKRRTSTSFAGRKRPLPQPLSLPFMSQDSVPHRHSALGYAL